MQNKHQNKILAILAASALVLSGCSQISGTSQEDANHSTVTEVETLRSAPEASYGFGHSTSGGHYYGTSSSAYAGYDVELYNMSSQSYYYGDTTVSHPSVLSASYSDPREVAFVKLNGQSSSADWQNCETRHKGYLYLSEYDFRLEPNFEVCMRNKGYVMASEIGSYSTQALTAKNSGLRGYAQSYSYSNSYRTGSYYP